MTTYRTEEELTIFFGPGAVNLRVSDAVTGWLSADVGLKLEYHFTEGATRAVLEVIAEQVDPILGIGELHITQELTRADLVTLGDTINAILTALGEDAGDDAYLG